MMDSLQRIKGMLLRYFYILRQSPPRVIEIMYWPTMQMILWGFVGQFFTAVTNPTYYAVGIFLGAILLWDMMMRAQLGVSLSYLEEIWARNLGHLFVSPLRPWEWWISMMIYSLCRALIGMLPAAFLALWFYNFSIFDLGLPLLFFFFNLMMMGWWLGFLVVAILLRTGLGAEGLAWGLTFFLSPFSAVYYPVSILPPWLQTFAHALPSSHVFEGLRALIQRNVFEVGEMQAAFGLNCLYLIVSVGILRLSFEKTRKEGTFIQSAE